MRGYLVLETGEFFEGKAFGSAESAGEVVFNTSHSGYEEIATDPSYFSQIMVMTAPMMGNYGVNSEFWESKKIWIKGFVCLQIQESKRDSSWIQRLNENEVAILSEVDTRRLVLHLRDQGTPWGAMVRATDPDSAKRRAQELIQKSKPTELDWPFLVSQAEGRLIKGQSPTGPRVAVMDFGTKENILRELTQRSAEVRIFSPRTPAEEIQAWAPDALMLSNGPGDPSQVKMAPETVKSLVGQIPIFGICMGHQILGIALGGRTAKLKFGHRGSNHPIRDRILNKIYMTAQNHGYVVLAEGLPTDVKISHVNLNDESVAGIFSEERRILGVQFHPESHPGPHDAVELFDFFINKLVGKK